MKAPLRKIVGHIEVKNVMHEQLECGHSQRIKQDIYGETNAVRRRCKKCLSALGIDTRKKGE